MPGVAYITHAGKQILSLDVSGSRNSEEIVKTLARAEEIICASPPKSVRVLTNVTDTRFNKSVVDRLKQLSNHATPHILASAAVGVSGLKEIVAQGLFAFIGRQVQLCPSVREALDWLAAQQRPVLSIPRADPPSNPT